MTTTHAWSPRRSTSRLRPQSRAILDTVTGADAERLYARLGWQRVGEIPGYALWPEGGLCSTTVFYRDLSRGNFAVVARAR